MSSNGGWVMFIVRYHVRSPEFWKKWLFRLGVVAYFLMTLFGMLETAAKSNSP